MKKLIFITILFSVSACNDSFATIKNGNLSEHNITNSTPFTYSSVAEKQNNLNSITLDCIYFSYKICTKDNSCQLFKPLKKDDKFYLSRDQESIESQYYFTVKNKKINLYSLKFLDEELLVVGTWAEMKASEPYGMDYKVSSINQVMGTDYKGRYNNEDLDKKLNTVANQTGLLEIGSTIQGSEFPSNETIKFIRVGNDYKVDCNSHIEEYEKVVDASLKQGVSPGFHFYYECLAGKNIYFHKIG